MAPSKTVALALTLGLAPAVLAQTSTTLSASGPVISLFLPPTDPQVLVGSLIGSSDTATTVLLECPPGTDSNDCGYPSPGITVTAGPSTFHAAGLIDDVTYTFDCKISGTTAADCSSTEIGPISDLATDESLYSATGTTTVVDSSTLGESDVTFYPITITAGPTSGLAAGTTVSGSRSTTSARQSSATVGSGNTGGSGTSSSTTTSGNDAKVLVPGAMAAGLLGLAAVFL